MDKYSQPTGQFDYQPNSPFDPRAIGQASIGAAPQLTPPPNSLGSIHGGSIDKSTRPTLEQEIVVLHERLGEMEA